MNMKSLRTGVAAALGGAVLLAGLLVGASIAFADESDEPETTVEEKNADGMRGHCLGFHLDLDELAAEFGISLEEIKEQLRNGASLDEIAEDLGVDLEGAVETLKREALDAIDEKVAAGDLTQERADELKEMIEALDFGELPSGLHGFRGRLPGNLEFGFGFGEFPRFGGFLGDADFDFDLEELHKQLESGLSWDDALAELGVDLDQMLEEARRAALEHIDELVTDGVITQERADELKEMIEGFELGEGFPFGRRGVPFRGPQFDFDRFGDFDFDFDLEELREQLESGLSWDDALAELGVDLDQMLEEARRAALEHIDELVTDGVITQERADELKEMIEGFELGDAFPFRGPQFDFDRFGDFDLDSFRGPRGHSFRFFGGDDGSQADAENALLNT